MQHEIGHAFSNSKKMVNVASIATTYRADSPNKILLSSNNELMLSESDRLFDWLHFPRGLRHNDKLFNAMSPTEVRSDGRSCRIVLLIIRGHIAPLQATPLLDESSPRPLAWAIG